MRAERNWKLVAGCAVGLVCAAYAFSSCGDSTADFSLGDGGAVAEGFFEGGTSGGGSIALKVGSIEKVFIRCAGEDFTSPDLNEPIGADGTFSVQFSADSRTFLLEGQFTSNSAAAGNLSTLSGSTSCDGPFEATRCAGCTDDDGNGVPDEVEAEPSPTPGTPTPTPTTTSSTTTTSTASSSTTSSTSTSSTTTTTGGGGAVPDLTGEYDVNSFTVDVTDCTNPASNGNFSCSDFCLDFVSIDDQTGSSFTVEFSLIDDETLDVDVTLEGTMNGEVTSGGQVSGTFSGQLLIDDLPVANVQGSFSGSLVGDILSVTFSGNDSVSGCSASGSFEGER